MSKVQIIRKKMKHIRLRVKDDGTVVLSAPHHVSDLYVHQFLKQKADWIEAKKAEAQMRGQTYRDGDLIRLFAKSYTLVCVETKKRKKEVYQSGGFIYMHIPIGTDEKQKERLMHQFYAAELKPLVIAMVEMYEQKMGVSVSTLVYQHMQTRWGTCNIETKKIRLNTRLAMYPLNVVESVVVHEMVHLLERGHNERFYHLMDVFYPEWQACDKVLRGR